MAEPDPLNDLFGLLAAPIAGTIRSVDQFRRGVDEFLNGVENFNRTMENLNDTAERVNVLLAEVEEPLRAAVPQVTRTVKTADQMMQVVSGPAMAAAPALERMASIMSSPEVEQIPRQMQQFTEVLSELSSRLGPLTQLAGTAGGLFGGLRIPGFSAPGDTDAKAAPPGVDLETVGVVDEPGSVDDAESAEPEVAPRPQHDPVADVLTEPPLDDSPTRTPPPTRISRTNWGDGHATRPVDERGPKKRTDEPAEKSGPKKRTEKTAEKSGPKKITDEPAEKSGSKKRTEKPAEKSGSKKSAEKPAKSSGPKKRTAKPAEKSGSTTSSAKSSAAKKTSAKKKTPKKTES